MKKFLNPEVAVPVVYLIFLLFAAISFELNATSKFLLGNFEKPSILSYSITLLGIGIFALFAIRRITFRRYKIIPVVLGLLASLTLYLAFPTMSKLGIIIIAWTYAAALFFISKIEKVNLLILAAILLATLSSFTILYRGVPILNPAIREAAAVAPARALFHGFAVFAGTLLAAFYERKKAIPGILFLVSLGIISGFKSDAISILISATIAGLLLDKINAKEIGAVFAIVAVILALLSTHIAGAAYGEWSIPPVFYIFYRSGFTFSVFNKIAEFGFPFGYLHGASILDPAQKIVSMKVLSYTEPHIITSTLLGPGMLDFGVIGVILTSALLGAYLGIMRLSKNQLEICLYSIALTHTLILIEVGLQLSSVLFYISLLYLKLASEEK